ncbi:hypothetical protein DCAR_0102047 [Daucus carota subsp. sativus]|uniref:Uncharacterized protein n=1 Tax=Daucus carota subsp. sativus TaxID=79200 RepID=A0A162AHX1_DAUCS|nr:hypothetical protein DCAR_0102047 [Daucus carota subsp. sativus]
MRQTLRLPPLPAQSTHSRPHQQPTITQVIAKGPSTKTAKSIKVKSVAPVNTDEGTSVPASKSTKRKAPTTAISVSPTKRVTRSQTTPEKVKSVVAPPQRQKRRKLVVVYDYEELVQKEAEEAQRAAPALVRRRKAAPTGPIIDFTISDEEVPERIS